MERAVEMSILALYVAVSCALVFRLHSQVRVRLPREQSVEFMPIWNYWRMLQLHREFYPSSRLRLTACLWEFGGAVAVFLVFMFWKF